MQRDRDPLIEQLEALRRRLENVRLEEEHLVAEIAIAEVRARRGRGEQPHPPPAFHIDVDPPVFALLVFAPPAFVPPARAPPAQHAFAPVVPAQFHVGDRVEITNVVSTERRDRFGVILRITPRRILVRTDSGTEVRRAFHNIQHE